MITVTSWNSDTKRMTEVLAVNGDTIVRSEVFKGDVADLLETVEEWKKKVPCWRTEGYRNREEVAADLTRILGNSSRTYITVNTGWE